jgi:hypothetical protein
MNLKIIIPILILCFASFLIISCSKNHPEFFTNTIGMKMIHIPPGAFQMGDENGQWDEQPVHKVTISQPFFIAETEVTIDQFKEFRPEFEGTKTYAPYASGVSWYDATAFCDWLSQKEGKPYRLPTEAEWEYVCRAGTKSAYSSGNKPPDAETPNNWGVKNMHTGVLEWCLDWYGEYPHNDQTDPIGRAYGFARVIRGGLPDDKSKTFDYPIEFYARSANRAGLAPNFGGFVMQQMDDEVEPDPAYDQFQPGLVGIIFDDVHSTRPLTQLRILQLNSEKITWKNLNDWSAIWQGSITAPFTGEVQFWAEVDNGLTLTINEQTVIDVSEPGRQATGVISMVQGKKYPILLRYFQDGGESFMRLYWSWQGQEKIEISGEALSFNTRDQFLMKKKFAAALAAGKRAPAIGFRIVHAPPPQTSPIPEEKPFVMQGVKQESFKIKEAIDPNQPYFRKRFLLPVPPENVDKKAIVASGFSPYFGRHNHDPGFEVCPNGDLLVVLYTSIYEDEPEVALIASRLRFGADEWDQPSPFIDCPDVNDVAPNLWNDGGKLYFFFGHLHLDGTLPFQLTTSTDNGATWSEIYYPKFSGVVGPLTPQPINSTFRDQDGTIFTALDGLGATSLLFASKDDGKTWYDTGGRSGGRHTTFELLKNGTILGMGGKHSDINGFMPKSISHDHGKTWEISPTPFPCLGTNQRPTLIRLASGRLFFASDFQRIDGFQPEGFAERGSFVALSDDEGKTWRIKKLPGGQEHESEQRRHEMRGATLGYAVARQAQNGIIHLIATMTHPCLHFALNEAWILSDQKDEFSDNVLMKSSATRIDEVHRYEEKYPNGNIRIQYSGGIADDGRFLLAGTETWFYENGIKQYEATFQLGKKVGLESYWNQAGTKMWEWNYLPDGTAVWTQWWENGKKKAESRWRNGRCEGVARRWSFEGKLVSEVEFVDGNIK